MWDYLKTEVPFRQVESKMDDTKKITLDFENSLKELEKIVRELESGEVNLDESLNKFEVGIELYKKCRQTLENAEKRIKILSDNLKEIDYRE
jgi:exodeoxyribonuclease VII small subunit